MKYDDLEQCAKSTALDWLREQIFNDSSDWEHIYTDAAETGALFGIVIHDRYNRTVGGVKVASPNITFSGFYQQGDGAAFSGTLRAEGFAGAVERMKTERPTDAALHGLATQAEALHDMILVHRTQYRLSHADDEDEYPECTLAMSVVIEPDRNGTSHTTAGPEQQAPWVIADAMSRLVKDFAWWIYQQLRAEYEHQTADATLEENIRANDYNFDEDGKRE